jgi:hypothetical protein
MLRVSVAAAEAGSVAHAQMTTTATLSVLLRLGWGIEGRGIFGRLLEPFLVVTTAPLSLRIHMSVRSNMALLDPVVRIAAIPVTLG